MSLVPVTIPELPAATLPLTGAEVFAAIQAGVDVHVVLSDVLSPVMLRASNLSDLANVATARANLGLGTAATTNASAYDAAGTAAGLVAGKVDKATLNANSVLYATTDDTPAALSMGASTMLARLATGNIVAATPAQIKTLLSIAMADVTGLVAALNAKIAGVRVEDEGATTVATATALNFVGTGVTVTDGTGGEATITIAGGGIAGVRVEDEGTSIVAAATGLNFAGAGVTVTDATGGEALVTIPGPSGVRVEDEGTSIVAAATGVNFVGGGVTVTNAGSNEATVTVAPSPAAETHAGDRTFTGKVIVKADAVFDVRAYAGWDPIAANNDAAFTAALAAAVAAGGGQVLIPRLLKIGNTNHLVTPPCGLVGMGGGFVGAQSTILCTHANSRVSFGDQTTARFGGLSQGFFVDGDEIATNPLYIGVVSSPVFLGIDVARSTAAGINLLLEGTQNGFLQINSYNGGTLCKIDKGAFTNYFPKVEFSEAAVYHLHFGANAGAAILSGIAYTGHNVFDTSIFERSLTGNLGAVLHEAGFHNELRHCVLAGEDIPTYIKVTKPTASPSARFHLNGVSIEAMDSPVVSTGIDIAANCTVDFEQFLSLSALVDGIVYDDAAVVSMNCAPTFASVTNDFVGTAAFKDTVFRHYVAGGSTYEVKSFLESPLRGRIAGDTWHRWAIDGVGDYYRGSGSVAPVKVLGAQGAAVTDAVAAAGAPTQAEFNALVTKFNALLARLRASTGHGLIE